MTSSEPIAQLSDWLDEARAREVSDAEAMSVATVDADGRPHVRMVLVRGLDERGLVFYTNLSSPKSQHLVQNPWAALCFHWKACERQVRVEGRVVAVSDAEADDYFASRERESQIGAWASRQSSELSDRSELLKRFAQFEQTYAGQAVPRPEFWSGFRVVPEMVEFWQKAQHRLHERSCYTRSANGDWRVSTLYP